MSDKQTVRVHPMKKPFIEREWADIIATVNLIEDASIPLEPGWVFEEDLTPQEAPVQTQPVVPAADPGQPMPVDVIEVAAQQEILAAQTPGFREPIAEAVTQTPEAPVEVVSMQTTHQAPAASQTAPVVPVPMQTTPPVAPSQIQVPDLTGFITPPALQLSATDRAAQAIASLLPKYSMGEQFEYSTSVAAMPNQQGQMQPFLLIVLGTRLPLIGGDDYIQSVTPLDALWPPLEVFESIVQQAVHGLLEARTQQLAAGQTGLVTP